MMIEVTVKVVSQSVSLRKTEVKEEFTGLR